MSVCALKRPCAATQRPQAKRLKLVAASASEEDPPDTPPEDANDEGSTQAGAPVSETNTTVSTPRAKKFLCDYPGCGKAYTRPVRLAEHQRSHTNERPFACDRDGCDKTFLRDSHLKHHIKSQHDNTRDWKCDWPGCGQAFATGTRMRTHRARHDEKEQFRCTDFPPCNQQFRKAETLERHIASAHLDDSPYVCDHVPADGSSPCTKRFKQASSLHQHQARDHDAAQQKYFCNQCTNPSPSPDAPTEPTSFPTYTALQSHIREAHPPTCPLCALTFSTSAQLKAHIDISHTALSDRRTIPCLDPSCDRVFTRKGNMQVHYRSTHAQHKFTCGEIDLSNSSLAGEWDGTGACGHGFVTKAALEKHVRTQHLHLPLPSTGRARRAERKARMANGASGVDMAGLLTGVGYDIHRPLPCALDVCPQRFRRAYDLEMHLAAAHGYNALAAQDAAEQVREREALCGGDFWMGDDDDDDDGGLEERLVMALGM